MSLYPDRGDVWKHIKLLHVLMGFRCDCSDERGELLPDIRPVSNLEGQNRADRGVGLLCIL